MSNSVMSAVNNWIESVPQNGRGMWIEETKGSVKWINRKDYKFFKHKGRLETVFGVMQGQLGELSKTANLTSDQITHLIALRSRVTDKFFKYRKTHSTFILGFIYRRLFARKLEGHYDKILKNIETCLTKNLASLPKEEFERIVKKIPLSQIKLDQLSEEQKSFVFDENVENFYLLDPEDRQVLHNSAFELSNNQLKKLLEIKIILGKDCLEQIDVKPLKEEQKKFIISYCIKAIDKMKVVDLKILFSWVSLMTPEQLRIFIKNVSFPLEKKSLTQEQIFIAIQEQKLDINTFDKKELNEIVTLLPDEYLKSLSEDSVQKLDITTFSPCRVCILRDKLSQDQIDTLDFSKWKAQEILRFYSGLKLVSVNSTNTINFNDWKFENILSFLKQSQSSYSNNIDCSRLPESFFKQLQQTTYPGFIDGLKNCSAMLSKFKVWKAMTGGIWNETASFLPFLEMAALKRVCQKLLVIFNATISKGSEKEMEKHFPLRLQLARKSSLDMKEIIFYGKRNISPEFIANACGSSLETLSIDTRKGVVSFISKFTNLSTLDIKSKFIDFSTPIETSLLLENIASYPTLKEFSITKCHILDPGAIEKFSNLRKLRLDNCTAESTFVEHLSNFTNLEELALNHYYDNTDPNPGLVLPKLPILPPLAKLKHLTLIGSQQITDISFVNLIHSTQLEHLTIRSCNLITNDGLNYIAAAQNLTNLVITHCPGITNTVALAALIHLKDLRLSGCSVTNEGLIPLIGLPELQILSLISCSHITDAGILQLSGCLNLRELHLGNANITDECLRGLRNFPALEKLYLGKDAIQITEEGIELLHGHKTLKTLEINAKELNISSNFISDRKFSFEMESVDD